MIKECCRDFGFDEEVFLWAFESCYIDFDFDKVVEVGFGKECVGESKKVKCDRKNKSVIKNLSLSSEMVLDQGKVSPLSSKSEQSRSLKMWPKAKKHNQ